jgi:hypothetical protein
VDAASRSHFQLWKFNRLPVPTAVATTAVGTSTTVGTTAAATETATTVNGTRAAVETAAC